jgi:hypothetical protein
MGWCYKNPTKEGYYWLCFYPYHKDKQKIHLVKVWLTRNENEAISDIIVECEDWDCPTSVSNMTTMRCWDGPLCPMPIPNRP